MARIGKINRKPSNLSRANSPPRGPAWPTAQPSFFPPSRGPAAFLPPPPPPRGPQKLPLPCLRSFGWRAAQQPQRLARPDRLRARWAVAQPPPPSPVGPTCKPQASRPLFIFSLPQTRVLLSPSRKSLPRRLSLPPSPGRRRTAALHLVAPPSLLKVSSSRSLLPVPFPLRSRPRHARHGVRPGHGVALRAAMARRRGSSAPSSVRRPRPLVLPQLGAAPRRPAQPPARGWPRRGSAEWRGSAMAAGARPWHPARPPGVQRSPPPAVGPGTGVLRAARGSGTRPLPRLAVLPRRDPRPGILRRPALAAGTQPWPLRGFGAVRSPTLAAGVRPWPRRGFGAVRCPAQLGGLLVRLARVACPRQRPTRSARMARPRHRGVARALASQLACGSPRGLLVAACAACGNPSATCSQQQLARVRSSGPRPRSLARVACSPVQRLKVTLNYLPFVCELSRDDALRHLKVLVPIELYPETAITRHRLIMLR
jgi:hypothetical protein